MHLWHRLYCSLRAYLNLRLVFNQIFDKMNGAWLTVLLGPTVLVRYLYPVMIVMPVMVILECGNDAS